MMLLKAVAFTIGLTFGQAKEICPDHKLIRVYNDRSDYYACDLKDKTVVLAFDGKNKLVGIFDLRWFLTNTVNTQPGVMKYDR